MLGGAFFAVKSRRRDSLARIMAISFTIRAFPALVRPGCVQQKAN